MKNNKYATILTGKYKNIKITIPDTDKTRSSKSILRKSFFDTIRNYNIKDSFIEAFAGSGLVGITAISEGFKRAYFIEKDKNVFKILSNNLSFIKKSSYIAINSDSFLVLDKLIDNIKDNTIIYYDPPFSIRQNNENIYDRCFLNIKNITNNNILLVAIEHMSGIVFPKTLGRFNLIKTKKFGKSSLSYYE